MNNMQIGKNPLIQQIISDLKSLILAANNSNAEDYLNALQSLYTDLKIRIKQRFDEQQVLKQQGHTIEKSKRVDNTALCDDNLASDTELLDAIQQENLQFTNTTFWLAAKSLVEDKTDELGAELNPTNEQRIALTIAKSSKAISAIIPILIPQGFEDVTMPKLADYVFPAGSTEAEQTQIYKEASEQLGRKMQDIESSPLYNTKYQQVADSLVKNSKESLALLDDLPDTIKYTLSNLLSPTSTVQLPTNIRTLLEDFTFSQNKSLLNLIARFDKQCDELAQQLRQQYRSLYDPSNPASVQQKTYAAAKKSMLEDKLRNIKVALSALLFEPDKSRLRELQQKLSQLQKEYRGFVSEIHRIGRIQTQITAQQTEIDGLINTKEIERDQLEDGPAKNEAKAVIDELRYVSDELTKIATHEKNFVKPGVSTRPYASAIPSYYTSAEKTLSLLGEYARITVKHDDSGHPELRKQQKALLKGGIADMQDVLSNSMEPLQQEKADEKRLRRNIKRNQTKRNITLIAMRDEAKQQRHPSDFKNFLNNLVQKVVPDRYAARVSKWLKSRTDKTIGKMNKENIALAQADLKSTEEALRETVDALCVQVRRKTYVNKQTTVDLLGPFTTKRSDQTVDVTSHQEKLKDILMRMSTSKDKATLASLEAEFESTMDDLEDESSDLKDSIAQARATFAEHLQELKFKTPTHVCATPAAAAA